MHVFRFFSGFYNFLVLAEGTLRGLHLFNSSYDTKYAAMIPFQTTAQLALSRCDRAQWNCLLAMSRCGKGRAAPSWNPSTGPSPISKHVKL